jgi:hypothetical protein
MVIFSAGRSPQALQPLLVSAPWPCERRRERCSWQPTYPVAYHVEYRDPHGVSSAAPAAPRALSAAVPSGGYAFPDAAQYVSCVVPDAARSPSWARWRAAEQRAQEPFAPRRATQSALAHPGRENQLRRHGEAYSGEP